MKKDTVVSLKKPVEESDPLTALLRAGAQQLLHEAVAAELAEYLSQYQAEWEGDGDNDLQRPQPCRLGYGIRQPAHRQSSG